MAVASLYLAPLEPGRVLGPGNTQVWGPGLSHGLCCLCSPGTETSGHCQQITRLSQWPKLLFHKSFEFVLRWKSSSLPWISVEASVIVSLTASEEVAGEPLTQDGSCVFWPGGCRYAVSHGDLGVTTPTG